MDANSLMIGDWYRNIEYQENEQWIAEDYEDINTDYIKPIKLTQEILKANGFEFTLIVNMVHYQHDFEMLIDNDYFTNIGGKFHWIRYVHELQHALRLCSLSDLADNFKV